MKTSIDSFGEEVLIGDQVVYYADYSAYSKIKGVNYKALNKGIVTKITPKGVTIDKLINRPSNKIYKVVDHTDYIMKINANITNMRDALTELAYLGGNPGSYGNSEGNTIAIRALNRLYKQAGL